MNDMKHIKSKCFYGGEKKKSMFYEGIQREYMDVGTFRYIRYTQNTYCCLIHTLFSIYICTCVKKST